MIRVFQYWNKTRVVEVDGEAISNRNLETVLNAIEGKGYLLITVLQEVTDEDVTYKVIVRKVAETARAGVVGVFMSDGPD